MVVLHEVEVESRRTLMELERAEILLHIGTPLCLNHNRPVITDVERKEHDVLYGKHHRLVNKDQERRRVNEWRKQNPDKRAEQLRRSVEQQREKRRRAKNVVA
jgi:hypothetical protein